MKFSEWIKFREVGTSTASIAAFKMPIGAGELYRRQPVEILGGVIQNEPKRKRKKKF